MYNFVIGEAMSKPTYEELEKQNKELEKSDSKYNHSDEKLLNSLIKSNVSFNF